MRKYEVVHDANFDVPFRVHAAGCKDAAKEELNGGIPHGVIEAVDGQAAAQQVSDSYKYGEVEGDPDASTWPIQYFRVMPCAKKAVRS